METSTFSTLPPEIVAGFLAPLEYQELSICRQVCKMLHKVIDSSSRLQYTLELGMHRMISLDQPGPGLSYHARRKLLRERETSWKHFKWRSKHSLDFPTRLGSIYEYINGFYANVQMPQISIVELPNAFTHPDRDTPARTWVLDVPDLQIVDFTMDPSQDLLIILAYSPPESEFVYDLHIRKLSTSEPHPRAENPTLSSFKKTSTPPGDAEGWPSFRVQVAGDLVALLVKDSQEPIGGYLEIRNYNRNSEHSYVMTLKIGIDDFSFISQDTYAIVTPAGLVEIWSFDDPSTSHTVPLPKAKFELPKLANGFLYWYLAMSANPTTGYIPHNHILSATKPTYHPMPNERIIAFCLYILNPNSINMFPHSYVFFVNARTFLRPPAAVMAFIEKAGDPDVPVPWEIWGPENTRWFPEDSNATDWQHALYGYRAVDAMGSYASSLDKRKIRVRDFNPYSLTRITEADDEDDGWRGRVVHEPSIIPARDAFAYDVVSTLPYREIESEELFSVTDVMMDDCRVLLLKRGKDGVLTNIDVMTL